MGKWEGLGFNKAILLKTMMVFLITLFIISLIFQYLIKSNKIKPCKISRLFYMDDEKFIKYWGKKRNKGKLKFALYYDVIISIALWFTSLIIIIVTDGDFGKLENILPAFYGTLIGSTIGCPLGFNKNENRYNQLIKNVE